MKTIYERGITFYVGQNKKENFEVIDLGSSEDIWFHAANESSCHVVLQLPGDVVLDEKQLRVAKKRGAVLCKQYTNKLASQKRVEIIYTHIKNVKKTATEGQVTATNTKSFII